MEKIKEIPSKGTRLNYNVKFVTGVIAVSIPLLIAILFTDIPDSKFEQIKWVVVFATTTVGIALGIYTASENGVKASIARMNK